MNGGRGTTSIIHHGGPPLERRVLEYLTAHSHHQLTNEGIASVLGCSRRTLSRVTNRHHGCSPRGLVLRVRMLKACAMLRQGWKVEAVSVAVGYRSRINFYRAFRACTGTSPGRFRCDGSSSWPTAIHEWPTSTHGSRGSRGEGE